MIRLRLLSPRRWSIAIRLATAGSLIIAAVVVLAVWLVLRQVEGAMFERAQDNLESSLKLERELLRGKTGGTPLQIDHERITAANGYVVDGDMTVVDTVTAIMGGTATLFRGDLRVSTNVIKPDGTRAIGTRLAAVRCMTRFSRRVGRIGARPTSWAHRISPPTNQ